MDINIHVDDRLVAFLKKYKRAMAGAFMLPLVLVTGVLTAATTIDEPAPFVPGQVISASLMNTRFSVIESRIAEMEENRQRVYSVEQSFIDLDQDPIVGQLTLPGGSWLILVDGTAIMGSYDDADIFQLLDCRLMFDDAPDSTHNLTYQQLSTRRPTSDARALAMHTVVTVNTGDTIVLRCWGSANDGPTSTALLNTRLTALEITPTTTPGSIINPNP